jgi:hypothetical protein
MAKKIYITETQFKNLVETKSKTKKNVVGTQNDYLKADRKARRDMDREMYGDGFKSNTRVHKTAKAYSRKGKNKFNGKDYL